MGVNVSVLFLEHNRNIYFASDARKCLLSLFLSESYQVSRTFGAYADCMVAKEFGDFGVDVMQGIAALQVGRTGSGRLRPNPQTGANTGQP
jgi:hypothetical protein